MWWPSSSRRLPPSGPSAGWAGRLTALSRGCRSSCTARDRQVRVLVLAAATTGRPIRAVTAGWASWSGAGTARAAGRPTARPIFPDRPWRTPGSAETNSAGGRCPGAGGCGPRRSARPSRQRLPGRSKSTRRAGRGRTTHSTRSHRGACRQGTPASLSDCDMTVEKEWDSNSGYDRQRRPIWGDGAGENAHGSPGCSGNPIF